MAIARVQGVKKITDRQALQQMMRRNNPANEPVGITTGRCKFCGSTKLWAEDKPKKAYGCNDCGASYTEP